MAHHNVTELQRGDINATDTTEWTASDELGVYLDGDNGAPLVRSKWTARGGSLLDGRPHHVRLTYTVTSEAWLLLYLDYEDVPAMGLPLALDEKGVFDEQGQAWVGFTAATGIASMDADLLSFAYTQYPGE